MQATTVAARGLAESPYTVAGFQISLSDNGLTVPEAKRKLQLKVDDLNSILSVLRSELDFEYVKNSVRTSSNVQEEFEYRLNKHELVGFIVTYNLFFQTEKLDKVNEIYDALTSLQTAKVSNPTFGLKPAQREKLNKKALKNAFSKAAERFETECKVLNLNPNDFEISNWEATYGDSQRGERVVRPMAARSHASNSYYSDAPLEGSPAGDGRSSLELISGLAEVVVNLEVGYARKSSQTVKAQLVQTPKGVSTQEENHV